MHLNAAEEALNQRGLTPPFQVTPYYAALAEQSPALRKTVVPSEQEFVTDSAELVDPLGEESHEVAAGLIHTYPDKVLFLATAHCFSYCRYCTRGRLAGSEVNYADEPRLDYIRQHPQIRDVLISGGDPLTCSDQYLDQLLTAIRAIPHVRTIRIGSKTPAVNPARITEALATLLNRHRVWLSLHFIHADELAKPTRQACERLRDTGVPMVSQTVLLKGVNDQASLLTELFYGLLEIGVKPYYLLQCDPVKGSAHFRTSVQAGLKLIQELHGRISGLAIPQYVIDAPGGGGKIPLLPSDRWFREGDQLVLTNHEGRQFYYPDPIS